MFSNYFSFNAQYRFEKHAKKPAKYNERIIYIITNLAGYYV